MGTKSFKQLICLIMIVVMSIGNIISTQAKNSTAHTYTMSVNGEWIKTQDAYLPGQTLLRNEALSAPSDIVVKEGKLYIADTGNARIVVMNIEDETVEIYGENILSSPTGIDVKNNGDMVIADSGAKAVYILSKEGKKIQEMSRPEAMIFGQDTPWEPDKVVADENDNIYVVGKGAISGLIQLSTEGEFIGYFGDNKSKLSLLEAIQDKIFTEDQKAKLFNRIPPTFVNVAKDSQGLLYTITSQQKGYSIKKHNVSGTNILYESTKQKMQDEKNFVDIFVGRWGQIYAITQTGLIYEYDTQGQLLYSFGGLSASTELNGTFTLATAITADENDCIYVLDGEKGIVQSFYPTTFANMTHEAMNLFNEGKYEESQQVWEQILNLSGVSEIAHNGLGKSYFNQQEFEKAAHHFKLANNKEEYSEAYWEIRNKWLDENMLYIISGVLILGVIWLIISILYKDKRRVRQEYSSYKCPEGKGIIGDLKYMWYMSRHPIDGAYYIKTNKRISIKTASLVLVLAIVCLLGDAKWRGFIFNNNNQYTNYWLIAGVFLGPALLWIICNYMVATINDGEGKFSSVIKTAIYALSPYILLTPIIVILSNILTVNESFVIEFLSYIMLTWCGVVLVISIKEIQNYGLGDTIKNILITLFLIFVILVAVVLMYSLWDSIIEFIVSVCKEVFYRATLE